MAESIIGKRIVLKSNSEIRYIGTLYAIDRESSAISLVDVLSLGTEDRVTPGGFVPPANTVYPYVVFRAADVRDIAVIDDPSQGPQVPPSLPHDPAIVSQGAPAAAVQQPSPFPPPQQTAPPPPPPAQAPIPCPSPAPAGPSAIVPPIAPSVATAHSTTLERLHPDPQKSEQYRQPSAAAPSRQPNGPVGIPFEQLAAQIDTHGPNRGSNHPHAQRHPGGGHGRGGPHRAPRGGRAPGAFSHAAQAEDVTQEFDFESMNKRFEELRHGEAPQGNAEENVASNEAQPETAPSAKPEAEEKPAAASQAPAYNKSSSFFDSVSSNIQNPSSNNRGRGGGRGGSRPRNFDQHTGFPAHPQSQSSFPSAGARGPPRPAQGREDYALPPRPRGGAAGGRNNNRRRDESALNAATFGDDVAALGGQGGRGGRMGGRGRSSGNGRPAVAQ